MEAQQILGLAAQGVAVVFVTWMLITLVLSQKKRDGLTGDEVAKVVIIATFIFIITMNGFRDVSTPPIFDSTVVLLTLGSLIGLAGIDIIKVRQITNGNRGKDSSGSK